MIAEHLALDDLAQRCAEETEKFSRHQSSESQFGFELLRRALANEQPEAFDRAYHIYERQVLIWVYRHSRFAQTGEDADYFAGAAWRTFYFALRGPKFAQFSALPQVLTYLKMCVHTAIAQYMRDQSHTAQISLERAVNLAHIPDFGTRAEAAELWAHICRLLPNERDRLLARCVFVLDLKPRQIIAVCPDQWASEREVSVALFRIRRLLRNDAQLSQQAGLNA